MLVAYLIIQTTFTSLDQSARKNTMPSLIDTRILLGWREWVSLPGLNIPAIKAKIDTGARTSALHAFSLETYHEGSRHMVRFDIHPLQKRTDISLTCRAPIVDHRLVSDSGGHREMRYVINTPILIGSLLWHIEITLTDRDAMQFRMLLGRTGMAGKAIVDPDASYLMGRKLRHAYGRKKQKGQHS